MFRPTKNSPRHNFNSSGSGNPTGVDAPTHNEGVLPTAYRLAQSYPNPFNPSTTIDFALPQAGAVELAVYDLNGRHVRTLVRGDRAAGTHQVIWHGRDDSGRSVASGIYIGVMHAGAFRSTIKMNLIK